ncbi:hypothetical protein CLAFUW4_05448 [Fulvia fulva]|uniref:Uncharacterized protein n=1 Tax=Passalora fulva TaxID=5499 RepID=A0A9Q8LI01_PASFU|nr:uncharacterized protein CLAFUR5_05592 [Fulvia fulva]KAK4623810.1 hypothetical protein CLAFUR4_05442 [Fulvia fulva]KAK4625797.1 hypothetical protein CLAFUR0_05450 [Fulvia fulva]UJO17827.1 hypothetical protein CLAFUR5_05592 [Fulvia fulva]WPV14575.1 hypothetical protein CLAFUW4_05448 [Fulvia fulva]WPV30573.1 hypothetical protein CLAFUW7_05446 [Fulvia fulva]
MKEILRRLNAKLRTAISCKHIRKLRKDRSCRRKKGVIQRNAFADHDLSIIYEDNELLVSYPPPSDCSSTEIDSTSKVSVEKPYFMGSNGADDHPERKHITHQSSTITAARIRNLPTFLLTAPAIRCRRQSDSFVYSQQELSSVIQDYGQENEQLQARHSHDVRSMKQRICHLAGILAAKEELMG